VANIKQQKKRIRLADKQRERNLRYRSTIRTLFKRLIDTAGSDDHAELPARTRQLEKLIDRAAAEGVIHKNNAARKKSRVARIAAGAENTAA
jgi:small subunit ribosomal protein S20